MCALFVLTVLSRQYGYKDYSDLGAYLSRFINDDNSYFSAVYGILTDVIRLIFGPSVNGFLISISVLVLVCAYSAVMILNYSPIQKQGEIKHRYIGTFLFLFCIYWGMSFSAEVIRSGLAISFSLVTIVSLLVSKNKVNIIAIIFFVMSILMHWTQIILLPFLLYLVIVRNVKNRSFKFYFILSLILLLLDFCDFSRIVMQGLLPLFKKIVEIFDDVGHYSVYFELVERTTVFDYLTRQYIYYHLLGLFFALFKIEDKAYIKLLNGYYYGLCLFTFLNGISSAITRTQWPLLILSVFLIYKLICERRHSFTWKYVAFLLYIITQGLLSSLYLGIVF